MVPRQKNSAATNRNRRITSIQTLYFMGVNCNVFAIVKLGVVSPAKTVIPTLDFGMSKFVQLATLGCQRVIIAPVESQRKVVNLVHFFFFKVDVACWSTRNCKQGPKS